MSQPYAERPAALKLRQLPAETETMLAGFAAAGSPEEASRLLVDQWGFTMEEAFVFLSVACDANICQACRPQPAARTSPSTC